MSENLDDQQQQVDGVSTEDNSAKDEQVKVEDVVKNKVAEQVPTTQNVTGGKHILFISNYELLTSELF